MVKETRGELNKNAEEAEGEVQIKEWYPFELRLFLKFY